MGAPVWLGYDQAGLDRQYNSRGTVPDVGVYLARYAAGTQAARAALAWRELRYGDGATDLLDVYEPTRPGAPVLVFLHGGDWRALSKADSGFVAPGFVQAGACVVVPEFSLVPAATIPQMGAQLRRMLAWVHAHIGAHGGDASRIVIAGHSSGANLVSQLLTTDWARDFGLPPDPVRGAVFMSGLGDLEPVRLSFRNANLQLTPDAVRAASLLHNPPRVACPMQVAVGEHEMDEYKRQARAVAAYWTAHGNRAEVSELAGRNHFDAVIEWADPRSALFAATLGMLGPG